VIIAPHAVDWQFVWRMSKFELYLAEQIKPISYLKSNAADIVKNFATNPETIIITQNGEAKMVVDANQCCTQPSLRKLCSGTS